MASTCVDEPAMQRLARAMAQHLSPPLTVFLEGDLGAGKTTFARALIQGAGHEGRVKSPTYGLMEHYSAGELQFLHLDLYRIADPGELEYLGMADLLGPSVILLVEWAAHGRGALPPPDIVLAFDHEGDARRVSLKAYSDSGIAWLEHFQALIQ